VRRAVRQRAGGICEYCHTSEQWQYVLFTIDHVYPPNLGGTDELDNLALACFHCNRQKSGQVNAADPVSGEEVPLFHPRQQAWSEHFIWLADKQTIVGLTPVGRATVEALQLNRERVVSIRAADSEIGRHPPAGDPIQESE
jgi:5-methylcytosine-specific restriction endonuclease McrA